jgi:four helix bundle protein
VSSKFCGVADYLKFVKNVKAMATIKSFEDLEIWKMARVFSLKIFEFTCKGEFARDFSLRNQINASTGSIMDNISEGFERGGNKEFILFLSYAKGSAGEARSQVYRAMDRKYITELQCNELRAEALEISKRISTFMSYLQNSTYKGSKFHEPEETYSKPSSDFPTGDASTLNLKL